MTTAILHSLDQWCQAGALRRLDYAFARFIQQTLPDSPDSLLLACALVSEHNAHGHACLDLHATLAQPAHLLLANPAAPRGLSSVQQQLSTYLAKLTLQDWLAELSRSPAVENLLHCNQSNASTPLVIGGSPERPLLYLRRYWHYEQQIQQAIAPRLAPLNDWNLDDDSRQLLDRLFPAQAAGAPSPDWQKVACLLAARHRFAIITGGPGTGKTTTVLKLLALLQGLRLHHQHSLLQIHLAAPTGKAAARLQESIAQSITHLPIDASIKALIPKEVTTLHRLLGSRPDSSHFRHHAANLLPTDLVVVDEASMMDIDMMASLVDALPSSARLILLGDKDQLASVEAGSVLADLCQGADAGHYQPATLAWLAQSQTELPERYHHPQGSALQQATCMLRHSYRFDAHPGIGALATAVNSGSANAALLAPLFARYPQSLHNLSLDNSQDLSLLEELACTGYRDYLDCLQQTAINSTDSDVQQQLALQVFAAHRRFQLLSAMRQGVFGIEHLNLLIRRSLQRRGLLAAGQATWYHGRPVLMTRNDYSLNLMNGDIGICMQFADCPLRVAFPDGQGGIRWVLPSRLQEVETVFAMTVHKSQGSEFTHTALVLPDYSSPVLTKELIYTAITRSKEQFTLVSSKESVLNHALSRKVERASGLNTRPLMASSDSLATTRTPPSGD